MSFTETLRIRPYQYKSPNGIEATRNLWCLTKIKGDNNKWFPCNWKGLIDRIKGTGINEEEKKRTIEEWMKILFGPKEERYPEIKKIPEYKEGELLISIMTAMSDQEEAEWQHLIASASRRHGGKSKRTRKRRRKRKTKRKKRKTKKRRRKRKRKTKKRR